MLWEKEKLLDTAISPFPSEFTKYFLLQTRKNQGLFWEKVNPVETADCVMIDNGPIQAKTFKITVSANVSLRRLLPDDKNFNTNNSVGNSTLM